MSSVLSRARSRTEERRDIDVLLVAVGLTMGLRRGEIELARGLTRAGLGVDLVGSTYGLMGWPVGRTNFAELTVALALNVTTTRALKTRAPRAIVFSTSLGAVLQPASRLRRSVVRYDALAHDNRPRRKEWVHRLLERRSLRHAGLLLPWGPGAGVPDGVDPGRVIELPTVIRSSGPIDGTRVRQVVMYASNPSKKGLDLAIAAWEVAALEGWQLVVTGIEEAAGRAFLASRGMSPPASVRWAGRLGGEAFRALVRSAAVFLNAAPFDEFGTANFEALADGALLVSTATRGPAEALALARGLASELVAHDQSPEALAEALTHAAAFDESRRTEYQDTAARHLDSYSEASYDEKLRAQIVPAILALGDMRHGCDVLGPVVA